MEASVTAPACAKIRFLDLASQPPPLPLRVVRAVRTKGLAHSLRRAAELTHLAPEPVMAAPARRRVWPPRDDERLGLVPGDVVEVKPPEEILETLDEAGMYKGLYFMGEMWRFCGQRLTVLKRVERIMVETTGEMRSGIRNTVLLDGACCDGSSNGGCDANCHHFWREVWLRRANGGDA